MRLDLNTIILHPGRLVHMLMSSSVQHKFFGGMRHTHKVVTFHRRTGVTTCVTIKYTAR